MSQKGDVGDPSGRDAAVGPLSSGTSLLSMQFRDIEGTIRYFQLSGQSIPSHFLETLCSLMVVSEEHGFLVGGDALADSLDSAVNSRVRHLSFLLTSCTRPWVLPVVRLLLLLVQVAFANWMRLDPWGFSQGFDRLVRVVSSPLPLLFLLVSLFLAFLLLFLRILGFLFLLHLLLLSLLLWFLLWLPPHQLSLSLSPLSPTHSPLSLPPSLRSLPQFAPLLLRSLPWFLRLLLLWLL